MTTFRVWAPTAERVEIVAGGGRRDLDAADGGWWATDRPDLGPGTDYAFSLDGGPPLPDPRSVHQPYGVHGASRVVDHASFTWHDGGWRPPEFADAIVYELHVGTFSPDGTFDGAIARLDALVDLGVTYVELMPVAAFPGERGWGYDGVDLFAAHEPYGGPEGLKRFVDACHVRELAVLLDVVYNHIGPDGNCLPQFGPYMTDRYRTPWGAAVNLDGPGSDEVRRFFCDSALGWLRDYHIDGLRIDAVHAIVDQSAVHLLEQLATETAALEADLGRDLVLVAESDLNDPRVLRSPSNGGYGLDASWSDDFHHALHVALTGERDGYYSDFDGIGDLVRIFRRTYAVDGRYSTHRGRRHGRPALDIAVDRFVVFSQNHDHVGNRALGERLAALVSPDALRVAATLVLAGPFVPLLFQGEEWAASTPFFYFTDHVDPELGRAVSDGRRRELAAVEKAGDRIPDPQDPATFAASRLDWDERGQDGHRAMLDWYGRLIELRRTRKGLRDGRRPRVRADERAGWLVIERTGAVVVANLGAERVVVPFNGSSGATLLAASTDGIAPTEGGVTMPGMSAAVIDVPSAMAETAPASGPGTAGV